MATATKKRIAQQLQFGGVPWALVRASESPSRRKASVAARAAFMAAPKTRVAPLKRLAPSALSSAALGTPGMAMILSGMSTS